MRYLFTIIISCGFLGVLLLGASCSSRKKFDPDVWRAWSVSKTQYAANNPRGRMLEDLTNNYLKVGMTTSNVLMMLGPPDESSTNEARYYLGGYSGGTYLPGYDYLVIKYGTGGSIDTIAVERSD